MRRGKLPCHAPDSLISATPEDHAIMLPNRVVYGAARVTCMSSSKEKRIKIKT